MGFSGRKVRAYMLNNKSNINFLFLVYKNNTFTSHTSFSV